MEQLTSIADVATRWQGARHAADRVWPTGFKVLDPVLGGGLRQGSLSLVAGPQGLGKTTFVLQLARNIAVTGRPVVFFSYEHDPEDLFAKLVSLEAGELDEADQVRLGQVRNAFDGGGPSELEERLAQVPCGVEGLARVREYAERLFVHRSTGQRTGLAEIRETVEQVQADQGSAPLVVVDYLQKVLVPDAADEDERTSAAVEGLRDLAVERGVAVVSTVAADKAGMDGSTRMRVNHVRGAALLIYEADLVLVLNDKYKVVARHHLTYAPGNAERFRDWVIVSVEKNRYGHDHVDLEFHKRFDQGRFDADGQQVNEQLVDERLFVE